MIYLASSSKTRAKILKDFGFDFKQINFCYDESGIKKDNYKIYPYMVVMQKLKQFTNVHKELNNVLFADSCVVVDNKIYGKANSDDEAFLMLQSQSGNFAHILTAMFFKGEKFNISNLSITTYKFKDFNKKDLENYIKSKEYIGKAGAMMIEGFNKKYIQKQIGNTSTAMGLNAEILKAYL
ncbi:septum formation inhibitor Maf [Campylobacter sp. FMV-PI01]|uniref:Septum formation inhibitor Maf n=1 Tax=Campylobacter portucalensis TaxID=2608384 RepID=A0A6L5WIG0_9BACT|nr:septum formation inhibitor Maf [Campylobacter portucalensis]MSN97068.1 septum formation inhibitor Maf [Campylobacter portucalensis]